MKAFLENLTQTNSTSPRSESTSVSRIKFHKKNPALEKFYKFKQCKKVKNTKNLGQPKKEYLRCKLIRGLKKTIRLLLQNSLPDKIGNFSILTENVLTNWSSLYAFVVKKKDVLYELSSTKAMVPDTNIRSYNKKFCKLFFSSEEIRDSFGLYVEFIFTDLDPQRLCEEFKFQCCKGSQHDSQCGKLWEEMRAYIQHDLISELGYYTQEKFPIEVSKSECKENYIEPLQIFQSLSTFDNQPKWVQKIYFRKYNIL